MPGDAATRTKCTWTFPGATGHIYLLGDSHAGQFIEPAIAAARRDHVDLTLATWDGCPFADVVLHSPSGVGICSDFITKWTSYLSHRGAVRVVIATRSSEYLHDAGLKFESPLTHSIASTTNEKIVVWRDGLQRTLESIRKSGSPVDLIETVPQFPGFDLRSCPAADVWWNPKSCGRVRSRDSVVAEQSAARTAESGAIRAVPGTTRVSFLDELCTRLTCSTSRGALWLYRDGSHLSVDGAMTLTPSFVRLFAQDGAPL